MIQTAEGRLLLAGAPLPLPRGAALTLQLPAITPQPAGAPAASPGSRPARLLAVDGRPLQPPPAVRLDPAPAPAISRAAPVLPAQVLTPAGHAAGPPIPVRVTVPPAPDPPPATAATATGPRPAASPIPVGTAAPAAATSAPADAGGGLPPGAALTAESAGSDTLGRPLLRAAGGLVLRLEPGAVDLPPGARLSVAFPQGLPPIDRPRARSADPLRTLVDLLRGGRASGAPARSLPRPDATLAARLLRFHEAVRRNDAALLLDGEGATGEPEAARAGADRGALREALSELARLAREPLAGGWRATPLPVLVDGAPEPLRLYIRNEDHPPPRGRGDEEPRRAVFDLDLSRLGRLQLDALCQGRSRFDLLVRSERALPAELRAEVAALFEAAKDVAGLCGELGFRPGGLLSLPGPRTPPAALTA